MYIHTPCMMLINYCIILHKHVYIYIFHGICVFCYLNFVGKYTLL